MEPYLHFPFPGHSASGCSPLYSLIEPKVITITTELNGVRRKILPSPLIVSKHSEGVRRLAAPSLAPSPPTTNTRTHDCRISNDQPNTNPRKAQISPANKLHLRTSPLLSQPRDEGIWGYGGSGGITSPILNCGITSR